MALSIEQQILIEQRITNSGKSIVAAYLLWFFFGGLGAHRFYLDKPDSAAMMLILAVGGFVTVLFNFVGFVALAIVYIWCFVDIFLIPGLIQEQKEKLRQSLTVEAMAANNAPCEAVTMAQDGAAT